MSNSILAPVEADMLDDQSEVGTTNSRDPRYLIVLKAGGYQTICGKNAGAQPLDQTLVRRPGGV